jgi:periplasmic mercuric ion binding protein
MRETDKTLLTILLALTAVTLVTLGALLVRPAVRADSIAILRAAGMTCGSCAGTIEKALQVDSAVAAVEVDVPGAMVTVAYDGRRATPADFVAQVRRAGFDSSLLRVLPVAQYAATTGRQPPGVASGCGCCTKKK